MRAIAVSFLLGLAVAACQSSALSSTAPPPAATSLPPERATPVPEAQATQTTIPITQCQTTSGEGVVTTPPPAQNVTIPSDLQSRLALYGDGYDVVMAPAGWWCQADIGADGSSSVRVWSPQDQQAQVTLETSGACFSCAISTACSVFASAAQQQASQFGACDPLRPVSESVQAETGDTIAFVDPPGVAGTGTGSGSKYESSGVVWYHVYSDSTGAAKTTCTLGPGERDLCSPILDFFRSGLPAAIPGSSPAAIVALCPPPTPPQRPTPPVRDCAIRLEGANATVVIRDASPDACEAAKHALLKIGLFASVDPAGVAQAGRGLLCRGQVTGLPGSVEVWDSGSAFYGTSICQGWDLVAP